MTKAGLLFLWVVLFTTNIVVAQDSLSKVPRIAVFAPLYLDSAFDASGSYRLGKMIPRSVSPGLDFYQGITFALDSLDEEGIHLDIRIYDTKSKTSVYRLSDSGALDSVDLMVGAVSGSDYLDLATVAREKQIPFVSATYPNDGGVSNNPYVIIVNSKLNTHLQALYNYVLRNHGTNNIVVFRRQNAADDRVTGVFKSLNTSSSGTLLNMNTVILNAAFTAADLTASLSKDRDNVIICGSLDDYFSKKLITTVAALAATYKNTLVGMPTWEGFRELEATELKTVPIIYSSTFFNPAQANTWNTSFSQRYAKSSYAYPSETAFRGYEIMYLFGHLLDQYQDQPLQENLSDKNFRVFTDFDFKPVHWSSKSTTPDYYENKRIYILRRLNGIVEKVN